MSEQTQYGLIKRKEPTHPVMDLLRVPHQGEALTVSHPAFGSNTFRVNVGEMQKPYSHPETGERISFREPTTSESISAAAYEFGAMAKPEIFDPKWLQAGYILKTKEGVFVNPPKDVQGDTIADEEMLKTMLNGAAKVNGIYLVKNDVALRDFGFAPYETFRTGIQDCDTFAESGLARLLEHTEEKIVRNFRKIASPKFYKKGVNVYGFDKVEEPHLRVVGLNSSGGFDGGRLNVDGDGLDDGWGGCAFGVLEETSEAGSPEKS